MQGPCDHIGLDDIPFVPSFSRPLILHDFFMGIFKKNNNFKLFQNRVLNKLDINYLKVSDFKSTTICSLTLQVRG